MHRDWRYLTGGSVLLLSFTAARGGGPTLLDGLDPATLRAVAASGRNTMPGFGSVYSAAELDDVVRFIVEELGSH